MIPTIPHSTKAKTMENGRIQWLPEADGSKGEKWAKHRRFGG